MVRVPRSLHDCVPLTCTLWTLLGDAARCVWRCRRSPVALAAAHLLLRTQRACSRERHITPRRARDVTRLALDWLEWWCAWRLALVVVQPATLRRWHREGVRLCWRWTSRRGRPPLPADLHALIRQRARQHPSWGQARLAHALLRKRGLRVSPRMEHAMRRILHVQETVPPTVPWPPQPRRDAMPAGQSDRVLLHDRDSLGSHQCDHRIRHVGLRVRKPPVQPPLAHALCAWRLGPPRRDCLDWVNPLTAHHGQRGLAVGVPHEPHGRPPMAFGPGRPPSPSLLPVTLHAHRHRLPAHGHGAARSVVDGLHHAYRLAAQAA